MDIMLLGPVELSVNGSVVELESDKVRCLIAALALDVGRPIPADRLMDHLWDGDPPANRGLLHTYVSRARRQLREAAESAKTTDRSPYQQEPGSTAGTGRRVGPPIIVGRARAHTYTLAIDAERVDRHRFRRLCQEARKASARGDDERAVELLGAAHALWRGEPLAGLPGIWPQRVRAQLAEEYAAAAVTNSAACLRLGIFEPLIAELDGHVQRHPSDEQLAGFLMLAYHGSRRHSDAVRLYQRVAHTLRRQFGTEPGSLLNRIYEGVVEGRLVADLVREYAPGAPRDRETGPASAPSAATAGAAPGRRDKAGTVRPDGETVFPDGPHPATAGAPSAERPANEGQPADAPVPGRDGEARVAASHPEEEAPRAGRVRPSGARPRMLPRQAVLEGRQGEMRQLVTTVEHAAEQGGPGVLATVSGMPGVGKTALAVAAAQRLAHRYPDGELYVDLQGHDGSRDPLRPEAVLGVLLRRLGTPPQQVPVGVDECAAVWRDTLASRRCVLVLDDAADAAQVAPLLPGDSASVTIITSRRYLAGLPEAHHLTLEALSQRDSIALFRRLGGAERTRDIGEVARIVRLCGYLPLAVELAAKRFHGRPTWQLGTLSERLARSPGRLAELRDMGSQHGVIRAFAMSYRTLTPDQRRAFRLLSTHPRTGFSAEAAAAVLDMSLPRAEQSLEALLSSSLLQETAPNRHKFHDLLAEYAFSLTEDEDSEQERDRAAEHLLSFYLGAAARANSLAYPYRLEPVADQVAEPATPPFAPTAVDARAWFERECEALLAVQHRARTSGSPESAAVLAQYLAAFLNAECHWYDAKAVAAHAVEHWRGTGRTGPLCRALLSLAVAQVQVGEYAMATERCEEALRLARDTSDENTEAEALYVLGVLHWGVGDYDRSLPLLEAAYSIRMDSGNDWSRASVENSLATTWYALGEYDQAIVYFRRAARGLRASGDRQLLAKVLGNTGALLRRRGEREAAYECFKEAIPLARAHGSQHEVAGLTSNLAYLLAESGDRESVVSGISLYRDALSLFRMLGDRKNQANALNDMGELYQKLDRIDKAIECHTSALRIADDLGVAHEQTIAHRCLGVALLAGEESGAEEHLRIAMALADRTHDRVEGVRARESLAGARWAAGAGDEAATLIREAIESVRDHDADEAARLERRLSEMPRQSRS